VSDLGSSAERAEFYSQVAAEAAASDPTTFTHDDVFAALSRCVDALADQLLAATHIRSGRPQQR